MKTLFNDNWKFSKTLAENETPDYTPVHMPHDWLIYNTEALYETSFGHYRKSCTFSDVKNKSIRLYFEGIYMDSSVFVNGKAVCDNKYGYSSFEADISDYAIDGENIIEVLVRHVSPNTRWYSGAGIFRDVWLIETPKSYIKTDGIYFHTENTENKWECFISAEIEKPENLTVRYTLKSSERIISNNSKNASDKTEFSFVSCDISDNEIWDISSPNLLELEIRLSDGDKLLDIVSQKVGLRKIEYRPDSGFWLNDKHIKLNGVCLHHDLGCLGAAFNKSAARRQLQTMLDAGVNAVRTSHNMPAKEFMNLCDEMGILVDSEAFDMWERPKTEFDYARFFPEWYEKDVASWIRRDRNHPSVIMWSVGNEIYDTHASPRGEEVAKMLHTAVKKHDPLCNAPTTIGSNYMPWDGAQNCAEQVDLAGYNYGENLYEKHHEKYPHWKIYGSETTAGVKSRGIYHFPYDSVVLTHEDHQCSSLDNCRAGISATKAQQVIAWNRDIDVCAGMFIWTGADYIGEPSPYSTKNAYFGIIDTAGLKKDQYYLYQSAWTDKSVLHLLPYWDFNDGQLIDVIAYTNLESAELFVNGVSMGTVVPDEYTCVWKNIPYAEGEIYAEGKDKNGNIICDKKHSFGDSQKIVLNAYSETVKADGEDLIFVEISTVDKNGYPVENAKNYIHLDVSGGRLVGFDNGDSTDYDQYKSASRKLFSGRAVAYIAPPTTEGDVIITASSPELESAEIVVHAVKSKKRNGADFSENITQKNNENIVPVRKIRLSVNGEKLLTPNNPKVEIKAEIIPPTASFSEIKWTAVTNSGIETKIVGINSDGMNAVISAVGDGNFRLRCTASNNKAYADVISELEFTVSDFGQASCNPYEFTPATLYNYSISTLDEVSKGGVNIKPDNNIVGFTKVDFGALGSKEMLVRIINWHKNDPFCFRLYRGNPSENGELIGEFTYQADFIWQTYQDNLYTLPCKLTGIQDIYFEFDKNDMRIDFGGFMFTPLVKAYEYINASDCDHIHGDNFEICGNEIINIGNNVFITYDDMKFINGASQITLKGRTHHENDSVHIHFTGKNGAVYQTIAEFKYTEDYTEVTLDLPDVTEAETVEIQFLPGCDFDLAGFIIR